VATARGDQQRRRAIEAAIAAIAEVGVDALRMTDIAKRAGMTPGHILYYFDRKDRILVEALSWSEHDLAEKRRRALARDGSPRDRVRRFVDRYLPKGTADPRWNLWLQVGSRPPEDAETVTLFEELIDLWRDDLVELVREGVAQGVFVEPELGLAEFARRGCWLLDGISLSLLSGSPGLLRRDAVRIGTEELETRLMDTSPVR
jgi:AcrR family transcriptional regulator